MVKSINFKALTKRVSIRDVAIKLLELDLRDDGNYLRGGCPAGDCYFGGDRSLQITPEKGTFNCHESEEWGDCISLVQHVMGMSGMKEAAHYIHDNFEVPKEEPEVEETPAPVAAKAKPVSAKGFDPIATLEKLKYEHETVQAIGLTPEVAKYWGIGYKSAGRDRGKVVQPVRTPKGDVSGFTPLPEDYKAPPSLVNPSDF